MTNPSITHPNQTMHLIPLLLSLSLSLSFLLIPTSAKTLNITVINAQNNHSTLECWALEPGFQTSSQAGTAGTLALNLGLIGGAGANATYTVLPPGFEGGRHNAPARQYVHTPSLHWIVRFVFGLDSVFQGWMWDPAILPSNKTRHHYQPSGINNSPKHNLSPGPC